MRLGSLLLAALLWVFFSCYPLAPFSFALCLPRPRFAIHFASSTSRSPHPYCLPVLCLSLFRWFIGGLLSSSSLSALSATPSFSDVFFTASGFLLALGSFLVPCAVFSSLWWLPFALLRYCRAASYCSLLLPFWWCCLSFCAGSLRRYCSLLSIPLDVCGCIFPLRLSSSGLLLSAYP